MPDGEAHAPHYQTVEFVLDAVAGWINKYRQSSSLHDEFGRCSPEDVMQIAKDLGVPVDPQVLVNTNPAVMRDLQRLHAMRSAFFSSDQQPALSAAKKVVANTNWPRALLPKTTASSVRMRSRSTRCSNRNNRWSIGPLV